jgi:DNA helicase-2/ATP-dependent DNA helicase PcrA
VAVTSPDQYLAELNPAQREAVLATEGPVLVVAGAGSGKTRVLTYRIAHLVAAVGVKPQEILAITFTNKAAGEMRERLQSVVGAVARTMWVMTFHAACGRILRREAPRLGYRSNFTIYDQADQVRLEKQCLEELDRDPKRFVPRGIHAQISNAKNQLVSPEEYKNRVASFFDQTVADVYELYQRRLLDSNAADFDDLLMLTVEVLDRFPEARKKWQKAFRYVLVDEYQDTNHAQYRLLQLLAGEHKNVFAVGDPDQSIYAFRGADIRNIMEFERDFGGAKQIALEQNYRSTNAVLRAANAVISENRERKPKNLWSELGEGDPVRVIEVEDEHAEARFVAAEIAGLVDEGFAGSEIAVFYRTNAQSRVVEDVLVRQDIPYQVIGGPKFYERAEIKDAIAYLQAIDNPSDAISLTRIANRPRRGIGDASLARLQTYADAHGLSLWEALEHPEEAGCGGAPLKAIDKFRTLMQSSMAGAGELPVPELLERVLEQSGYLEALEAERTIEAQGRIENLQELVGVAREYQEASENPSLSEFLQQISLFSDQDAIEEALTRRDISYQVIGGPKFYERAEIKDAIAYLTVLANPQDAVSFTRIVNSPRRGIGQTSLGRVLAFADAMQISIWDAAADPEAVPGLGTAAVRALGRFMDTMQALRERVEQRVPIGDLLEALLHETGYIDALKAERTIEAQGREENLAELVEFAREFDASAEPEENTLDVFLQGVSLVADADTRTDDEGLVTLMTIHNAKGL